MRCIVLEIEEQVFGLMHKIRDDEKASSKFAEACDWPSFGNVKVAQPLEQIPLVVHLKYDKQMLDLEVYPRLLHLRARALHDEFTNRMRRMFPDSDPRYHLVIGPVKKVDRITTKVRQEDASVPFPQARTIKDALRNTVACVDGDALVDAYHLITKEFGLVDGRGRRKNKLGLSVADQQPPSMLLNIFLVPIECEGQCIEMLAEVQLHLEAIKALTEVSHKCE